MSVGPAEAVPRDSRSTEARDAPPDSRDDLLGRGATAFAAARDGARHLVELAAAEARLAALSGVSMLLMIIVAAAVAIVGWGFLASVVAYLLVMLGLSWPAAGLTLAAAHALTAYLLWRGIVRLSANLTLPTLRRTVMGSDDS